jgi:cytochrome c
MPRTAISALVCITFLMLLGSSALPQEPGRKGADTESGQLTFNNACRTCHTTKEGDNRLGPNLHNIIGRKAGSLPNYGYSSAMKGADFVWDKEKLDRFIAKPDEVVPGNNMKPYGGITSSEDRAKVIVFLESPTTNWAVTSRSRSEKGLLIHISEGRNPRASPGCPCQWRFEVDSRRVAAITANATSSWKVDSAGINAGALSFNVV